MFLLGNEGSFGGLTVSNGCDASWAYIDLHWPETPVGQSGKLKMGARKKKIVLQQFCLYSYIVYISCH